MTRVLFCRFGFFWGISFHSYFQIVDTLSSSISPIFKFTVDVADVDAVFSMETIRYKSNKCWVWFARWNWKEMTHCHFMCLCVCVWVCRCVNPLAFCRRWSQTLYSFTWIVSYHPIVFRYYFYIIIHNIQHWFVVGHLSLVVVVAMAVFVCVCVCMIIYWTNRTDIVNDPTAWTRKIVFLPLRFEWIKDIYIHTHTHTHTNT